MMLSALALSLAWAASAAAPTSFAGRWETTFGEMTLESKGGKVRGRYIMGELVCPVEGVERDGVLEFKYTEDRITGVGRFQLSADGRSFEGRWRQDGTGNWRTWRGRRKDYKGPSSPVGLWDSDFGRLRLWEQGGELRGVYAYTDGKLQGRLDGSTLTFRYKDIADGEGEFVFSPDGRTFQGRWRQSGQEGWQPWRGARAVPVEGRAWLLVLEAPWEAGLEQPEYSYGQMLKSFFSRAPHVEVRQRFFTDRRTLQKWLRQAALIAEPVVMYLSGHGGPEGLHSDDGPIGAEDIAAGLEGSSSVQLLHFGACQVMKGGVPREIQTRVKGASFPVSGFAQTVDWGMSAVTDFLYLDLILARGMLPEQAAAELKRLMPFAERASGAVGYDGVSFRFLDPGRRSP